MFGKHADYHGTRRYVAEKPFRNDAGQSGLRASPAFVWVKFQIEKFLRAGTPISRTTWLLRDGEKHFTFLGAKAPRRPREPDITDIFPIAAREAGAATKLPRKRR